MSSSDSKTLRAGPEPARGGGLLIRDDLRRSYDDIYTSEAIAALEALAGYNREIKGCS